MLWGGAIPDRRFRVTWADGDPTSTWAADDSGARCRAPWSARPAVASARFLWAFQAVSAGVRTIWRWSIRPSRRVAFGERGAFLDRSSGGPRPFSPSSRTRRDLVAGRAIEHRRERALGASSPRPGNARSRSLPATSSPSTTSERTDQCLFSRSSLAGRPESAGHAAPAGRRLERDRGAPPAVEDGDALAAPAPEDCAVEEARRSGERLLPRWAR